MFDNSYIGWFYIDSDFKIFDQESVQASPKRLKTIHPIPYAGNVIFRDQIVFDHSTNFTNLQGPVSQKKIILNAGLTASWTAWMWL